MKDLLEWLHAACCKAGTEAATKSKISPLRKILSFVDIMSEYFGDLTDTRLIAILCIPTNIKQVAVAAQMMTQSQVIMQLPDIQPISQHALDATFLQDLIPKLYSSHVC